MVNEIQNTSRTETKGRDLFEVIENQLVFNNNKTQFIVLHQYIYLNNKSSKILVKMSGPQKYHYDLNTFYDYNIVF